ncbi:Cytidylate kinase [Patulibacter medicamentivorans]|uniref:Cytidylate kinase n=1 Tax=Patulibacter medicamentivorans TaxID=1097667 RepID=H0E2H1_9ACTN|nr:cytidylate kinase-like family protein [Patulibacter medicamentivorans]EHN12125.1 Cytidylate kinase [Patulibacter medicamentivorans]
MTVITISASYGAGGSRIGPAVAERLGATFLDRAIPTEVSERLAVPLDDALRRDESLGSALERLLVRLAPVAQVYGGGGLERDELLDDRAYQQVTERVICDRVRRGSAVVLGRAGAFALRDHPGALHVRLDGPRDRRLAQAMRIEGIDRETAERRLEQTDRAREAYVRHFYRCDPRDPSHYHLVIESTTIPLDACVDMMVAAALARVPAAVPA